MADTAALIESYLAGAKSLRQAVAGMSTEQLRARPVAGKWSTLEVVCHIADFDPILADRMKRIISLEKPALVGADENLFAEKLGYQERDLDEELRLIETTRTQMARILKMLPAASFQRVGVHTERGELTLERILQLSSNHIPHHLPFIAEKRKALGLPA